MDSMTTTCSTVVPETASEILGKHCQKNKPWVTSEMFYLCDKRRELRKKTFEPEESEKYKDMTNNIKRHMKKAKKIGNETSVLRLKKIKGRTTVRGYTNSGKT